MDINAYTSSLPRASVADVRTIVRHDPAALPQSDTEQAVSQFSALLIEMMLDSMRRTVPASSPDGGLQREFFDDLLFREYAQVMADADLLHLHATISESLSR